jgi:hypothetical protein
VQVLARGASNSSNRPIRPLIDRFVARDARIGADMAILATGCNPLALPAVQMAVVATRRKRRRDERRDERFLSADGHAATRRETR